jgi:hypothetical protein
MTAAAAFPLPEERSSENNSLVPSFVKATAVRFIVDLRHSMFRFRSYQNT